MMSNQSTEKAKAIFLDRDGTLNADSADYIKSVDEFRIFDFTPEALGILTRLGFRNIIITNQSAVSRGMITTEILDRMHAKLKSAIQPAGAVIDGIYICPHLPEDNCDCRKPRTANLEKAVRDFQIDVNRSYFIGDSFKDIQTGAALNCRTIFVCTGIDSPPIKVINQWRPRPDYIVENLLEAAKLIECMGKNRKP